MAFILLFVFLRVNYPRAQTWRQRLAKIDITGNAIFSATIISVLIALTWAGTIYDWNNFHIIVPLVLGFLGVGVWIAFEWTVSKEPSFPRKIVSNRTSAAVLGITLLHSLVIYWGFYFLPVYFQAVKAASPFRAGKKPPPSPTETLWANPLTLLRSPHSPIRCGTFAYCCCWRRPSFQMGTL